MALLIERRPLRRVALIVESAVAPRRRMLSGVARYIHEHDPWQIYLKPFSVEKSLPEWIRHWNGDGIIAAIWNPQTKAVTDFGIPVVDLVGVIRRPDVPLVHTNDHTVGRLGAEHLLERGFIHFGFIEYPDRFWSVNRRAGFVDALGAHGAQCFVYGVRWPSAGRGGPETWEQQQRGMVEWIQSLPKPVGVMTSTDLMGQQFLEACQRAGVVVPEQVAVIGADNDEEICSLCFPPLSTVIINDHQRGYEAAALLDRLMAGHAPPPEPVYVEPSGVIARASTDIMAIDDEAIVAALRFVRDHACEGIGVDHVVSATPLSRTFLERRFRKVVGRSINNEIVRVRLNRAVELLSGTELALKAVAHKAGFGSTAYMGVVFREKLSRTPGSYRRSDAARGAGLARNNARPVAAAGGGAESGRSVNDSRRPTLGCAIAPHPHPLPEYR